MNGPLTNHSSMATPFARGALPLLPSALQSPLLYLGNLGESGRACDVLWLFDQRWGESVSRKPGGPCSCPRRTQELPSQHMES